MNDVVLRPKAHSDVRAILDYLEVESSSPTIRRRFLSSFEETCMTLAAHPKIGQRESIPDAMPLAAFEIRRFPVRRFPKYLIFYTVGETTISITRVLHAARNPKLRTADPS